MVGLTYQSLGSRRPRAMCSWSSSSYQLPFGGGISLLQNNSGIVQPIRLPRCFREKLKQRMVGKVPQGPAE